MQIIDDYVNPNVTTIFPLYKVIQKKNLEKPALLLTVVVFLISGTLTITLGKALYNQQTMGLKSTLHPFSHPLILTLFMFIGMSVCLLIHMITDLISPSTTPKHLQVTLRSPFRLEVLLYLITPSFCDFLSGVLMNTGLLYVASSVFQMLRGSVVIFTALLTVFHKRVRLLPHEVFALFFCASDAVWNVVLGVTFIILSMFLQALQTILEESSVQDLDVPPLVVVGLEGFYGIIQALLEYAFVSIREGFIIWILIGYTISITLFNITGMIITRHLNAMIRNILDPCRMITIWVLGIILYYTFSKEFGEPLGWQTALQIVGFTLLSTGLFIYTKVLKIPYFFNYNEEDRLIQSDDELLFYDE
ncbi:EamA domain-containing protein [Entamoeba marina]